MDGENSSYGERLRDRRLDAELQRDWLDRERAQDRSLEIDRWLGGSAERSVNLLLLESELSWDR